jgi:hypothetical protein
MVRRINYTFMVGTTKNKKGNWTTKIAKSSIG